MRYSADPHWLSARYPGKCSKCGATFRAGASVFYYPKGKACYPAACCGERASADFSMAVQDENLMAGSGAVFTIRPEGAPCNCKGEARMDPEACLKIVLESARIIMAAADRGLAIPDDDAVTLAGSVLDLIEWLEKGGFPPEWRSNG